MKRLPVALQKSAGRRLNPGTIRRLVLTLITGYLTIFAVRQIPYEFENEWLVIIPALIAVYALTVWVEGLIFKDEAPIVEAPKKVKAKKVKPSVKGFGDD